MTTAVLITGTSSGIGRATAQRLARRTDLTVYATARRIQDIADLAAAGAHVLALDVTDEKSMRAAVEAVEAEHGAVHVLVNNAGYGEYGTIEETGLDGVRRQFETNVFGLARLTQLVLPGMRTATPKWPRLSPRPPADIRTSWTSPPPKKSGNSRTRWTSWSTVPGCSMWPPSRTFRRPGSS